MSEIVTRVEDAQALLDADVLAVDVETDTHDYHWKKGWKRGLSFNADITYLSVHAGPEYPTLVLRAQEEEIPYSIEDVEYDEIEGYRWFEKTHETVRHRCLKKVWQILGEPEEDCDIELEDGSEQHRKFVEETGIRHLKIRWSPNPKKGQYGYIDVQDRLMRYRYSFSDSELSFLHRLLNRPITIIGHNLIFDARHIFGRLHINVHPELKGWCTQAMNIFLLGYEQDRYSPRGGKNTLLDVYEREVRQLSDEEKKWLEGMKDSRGILHEQDPDDVLNYVAWDTKAAFQIYEVQSGYRYEVPGDYCFDFDQLLEYELDYMRWCMEVSARGIRLDTDYLKHMWIELQNIIKENTDYLGVDPDDLGKTRKLKELLFDQWGLIYPSEEDTQIHPELLTNNGGWSMSKDALDWYANNVDDEDLKDRLDHLGAAKNAHDRIRSIGEMYRHAETDGRIHTLLARHTVTGRNNSGSPNLQNKTFHGDFSDRGLLIPDPGYVLIEQDYSNAEVWTMAMNAADEVLAKACCSTDFHSEAARGYFGAEVWDNASKSERKDMRGMGKGVSFGVNYGMGARSLAIKLTQDSGRIVTQDEAERLINGMKTTFQKAAKAMEDTSEFAERHEYCVLWTGRHVKVLSYYEDGKSQGVKGYSAWNSKAQGGVGEMIVQALVKRARWLRERGYETWDCLQVHDSIVSQVKIEEYNEVMPRMIEIMQEVVPDKWLNRTLPYRSRFLVTVDHAENAEKWGWQWGVKYPFDTKTYHNHWGIYHLEDGQDEAPTWINQWGYGEGALAKELQYLQKTGLIESLPEDDSNPVFVHQKQVSSLLNELMDRMSMYAMGDSLNDYLCRITEVIRRIDQNSYVRLKNSYQGVMASDLEDVGNDQVRKHVHMLMATYPYNNHYYDIHELWPRAQRQTDLAVECVKDWVDKQIISATLIFQQELLENREETMKFIDQLN